MGNYTTFNRAKAAMAVIALLLTSLFASATAQAAASSYVGGTPFQINRYYCNGSSGKGTLSGKDYANCKAVADGDVWDIPANTLISKVYVVVETAVTGLTGLALGDDDSSTGYASDQDMHATGLYAWSAGLGGTYVYTIGQDGKYYPNAKFYSAAGKEVKIDVTGAIATTGKFRVVIEGWHMPQAN